MPTFDTAKNVLNDAALGLGLTSSALTDPYASTDPNVVQLRVMLTEFGQDLLRQHSWTHLQTTHTFVTVDGTATYALPGDFDRLLDQTGWDRTQQFPLAGPINAQGWQLLQAQSVGSVVDAWFRIANNLVNIYPTPGATVRTLAFEYVSKYWVAATAAPTTRVKETPSIESDVCFFDRRLLITGLRLAFLEAKGFDTGAASQKYSDALEAAKGGDGAAPVLSLNGPRPRTTRYLDAANIPETGYGS